MLSYFFLYRHKGLFMPSPRASAALSSGGVKNNNLAINLSHVWDTFMLLTLLLHWSDILFNWHLINWNVKIKHKNPCSVLYFCYGFLSAYSSHEWPPFLCVFFLFSVMFLSIPFSVKAFLFLFSVSVHVFFLCSSLYFLGGQSVFLPFSGISPFFLSFFGVFFIPLPSRDVIFHMYFCCLQVYFC